MSIPLKSLNTIHEYFTHTKESLCVVESCTGGLLRVWLTHLPGSSRFFKGGLVSYKTEVKIQCLGLSEEKIKKEGLVTTDCAQLMAQGIRKFLKADWSVAITGIAGPSKGNLGEPIGKMAFSLSSNLVNQSSIQYLKGSEREDIRHQAALFALDFLISGFKYQSHFKRKT